MVEVAYYDVADKVINIIKVPYSLIGQTLFPKVARDRNIRFLKKIMVYTVIITVFIIVGIFLFSGPIIGFFSGSGNVNSINILKILSLTLLPISIGLFYGDLLLINFGLKTEYAKMRFMGLVVYLTIFLGLYFLKIIGGVSVALMIVTVETFLTIYSFFLCRRAGIV
jgi:O-antigen/teichoic acid export membrane protein